MMAHLQRTSLFIDGGGSVTRAGIGSQRRIEAQCEGESCNRISVGPDRARMNLQAIVKSAWSCRPSNVAVIDSILCCVSTVRSNQDLRRVADDVWSALPDEVRHIDCIWVANDIVPLLVHDGRVAQRVVAICGTGTGFCAINVHADRCVRASGHEYLLSDEGGGFDIGLLGLRAVIRAQDLRGPKTMLSAMLAEWQGIDLGALPSLVYSSAEPKVLVASFAKSVLHAAELGDAAACEIVERAANELALGIAAVADAAGLKDSYEILLSGSNLVSHEHPILRDQLLRTLASHGRRATIVSIASSPLQAIACLSDVLAQEPRLVALLERTLPFARFDSSLLV